MSNIKFIESLIVKDFAYEINGYILFDWTNGSCLFKKYPDPQPVQYSILNDYKRNLLDFPLFAPYINGSASPWGYGNMTANIEYIKNIIINFETN